MLVYLHGFNSSPASHKARLLGDWLAARGLAPLLRCPALPPHPVDALATIEATVRDIEPARLTFIGSSLGGFYATHFAEQLGCRAVLINPAIRPHEGLAGRLGPQENLYTGERWVLTRADLAGWEAIFHARIDPERYLLLLETGDEILDWRDAAAFYAGSRTVIRDGGDHSLQGFADHLPRILDFARIAQPGS